MIIKLFGIKWNLKPIIVFLWALVVFVFVSGFLACAFSKNVEGAIAFFLLSMVWVYITNTLTDNGYM